MGLMGIAFHRPFCAPSIPPPVDGGWVPRGAVGIALQGTFLSPFWLGRVFSAPLVQTQRWSGWSCLYFMKLLVGKGLAVKANTCGGRTCLGPGTRASQSCPKNTQLGGFNQQAPSPRAPGFGRVCSLRGLWGAFSVSQPGGCWLPRPPAHPPAFTGAPPAGASAPSTLLPVGDTALGGRPPHLHLNLISSAATLFPCSSRSWGLGVGLRHVWGGTVPPAAGGFVSGAGQPVCMCMWPAVSAGVGWGCRGPSRPGPLCFRSFLSPKGLSAP